MYETDTVPTLETFEIVFAGIFGRFRSAEHSLMVSQMCTDMDTFYSLIPNERICQMLFKIYADNGEAVLLTELLLTHSDIVFEAADIDVFNTVLRSLGENAVITEHKLFEFALLTIANSIMPRHPKCTFNAETYRILSAYFHRDPSFILVCCEIKQRNSAHDVLFRIVKRSLFLERVKHFADERGFQYPIHGDTRVPSLPQPSAKLNHWHKRIMKWRPWFMMKMASRIYTVVVGGRPPIRS